MGPKLVTAVGQMSKLILRNKRFKDCREAFIDATVVMHYKAVDVHRWIRFLVQNVVGSR